MTVWRERTGDGRCGAGESLRLGNIICKSDLPETRKTAILQQSSALCRLYFMYFCPWVYTRAGTHTNTREILNFANRNLLIGNHVHNIIYMRALCNRVNMRAANRVLMCPRRSGCSDNIRVLCANQTRSYVSVCARSWNRVFVCFFISYFLFKVRVF